MAPSAKVQKLSPKVKSARARATFVPYYAKSDGAPKRHLSPIMRTGPRCSDSKHLLSREDHKKPAFAGVGYLFRKRAIVALFALSSEFNSNFLKPNFCSTKRTIASLVISTFFAFSIMFSLINIKTIIQEIFLRSIGKSKKDELFYSDKYRRRRLYHTPTRLSRVNLNYFPTF